MSSGSREEAQKRISIIEDELVEVDKWITSSFIEIDVALHTQDAASAKEHGDALPLLKKRREALRKILATEKDIVERGLSSKIYFSCQVVIN